MKTLLRLEALGLVLLSVWLFGQLDYAWWWYPLLFFVPGLSMPGYITNTRIGTFTYNLIQHTHMGMIGGAKAET